MGGVPYLHTSDGRTIRYPDPNAKVNDSIQLDLATNKVQDIITFEVGNLVMVTGGANAGRVGTMISREKHPGSLSDRQHSSVAPGRQSMSSAKLSLCPLPSLF